MTDRPLSILMVSPQYAPLIGGYERAAERLSGALAARGHAVTVVADRREKTWPSHEVRDGVRIRRLPCIFRPRLHLISSLVSHAVFFLLEGRRSQVWHCHSYGMLAVLACLMGWLMGRPVILKLASSGPGGIANAVSSGRLRGLSTRVLRAVPTLVAMTRETEIEAASFGVPDERIARLTNPVDVVAYRPRSTAERAALKPALGLSTERTVVWVGRLDPVKNLDGLIRAWTVAAIGPEWSLVLVGGGPLEAALARQIRDAGLEDRIRMVGSRDDVERWMGAADVYVTCSHWEGLSNTMLEAMASGLPVVATRVSGVPEMIEATGAGLAVPVDDEAALAEALRAMTGDPESRERMGATARTVIEQGHAVDRVAEAYESLYRRLIGDAI